MGRERHYRQKLFLESLEPRRVLASGVAISEILALNENGLVDSSGLTSDWIELNNSSDVAVDVSAWYLTDDADDSTKWRIPSLVIPAGGYALLFASGRDGLDEAGFWHTSFSLDGDGEYLALIEPDGVSVAHEYSPQFPQQFVDVSYGEGLYFTSPTPGAANSEGVVSVAVTDIELSVRRGFYAAPFELEITTTTEDATIYYTEDGSDPTVEQGRLYDGPVMISETTVLRARAFRDGLMPTNVETHTYIFVEDVIDQTDVPEYTSGIWDAKLGRMSSDSAMDPELVGPGNEFSREELRQALLSIPTLSLVGDRTRIFDASGRWPIGERPVSMEMLYPQQSDWNFASQPGIEHHSRWHNPKESVRVNFKQEHGQAKLREKIMRTAVHQAETATGEFDRLILRAGSNGSFPPGNPDPNRREEQYGRNATYTRDQWARDAFIDMTGYGARGIFVHLYMNGIYFGLYNVTERPDAWFSSAYFGGEKEQWYARSHGNDGQGTDASRWNAATNPSSYDDVEQLVDTTNLSDYLILNWFMGTDDWPNNNWWSSIQNEPGGKLRFFVWDAEITWGLKSYAPTVQQPAIVTADAPWSNIWQVAAQNDDFRMLFSDRVYRHLFNDGALVEATSKARWDALASYIDSAIKAESVRWGDAAQDGWGDANGDGQPDVPVRTKGEFWDPQIDRVRNMMDGSVSRFIAELRNNGLYPDLDPPAFNQHGGATTPGFQLTMSNSNGSGTIYYTSDGTDPRMSGGVLAPAARVYDGAITLDASTPIKSRVWDGSQWSALHEATFLLTVPPALRVTEIMYNPGAVSDDEAAAGFGDNEQFEFIELQNIGEKPLDLDGVRFADGVDFTFAARTLDPSQFVVVVKNQDAFSHRYGDDIVIAGVYTGSLKNGGERLILEGSLGESLVDFVYDDAWYDHTDGDGFSLVVIDPSRDIAAWGTAENWRPSNSLGGSPGWSDDGISPDAIVINEVLTNTGGADGDWIELYNTTDTALDVGGWFLSNDPAQPRKFRIADGTTLEKGGYVLFTEATHFGADSGNAGLRVPFSLSELGGEVRLSSAVDDELKGFRASVRFNAAELEVTFGRHVNTAGDVDFTALIQPTPAAANAPPRVGSIVINEIMYHPADGDEFIELRNLTDEVVLLHDPAIPDGGWRFTDGINFVFPAGAEISAGGLALVVPIDPAVFRDKYNVPVGATIFGPYTGALKNGGEAVILSRPVAVEPDAQPAVMDVDRVVYDDTAPWPIVADGSGPSLARLVAEEYGGEPTNWRPGSIGGTPGRMNRFFDDTPPTAPLNLDASVTGATEISLNWEESVDLESSVATYRVYRNGLQIAVTTELALVDAEVSVGTRFSYEVSAVNGDGVEGARSLPAAISILTINSIVVLDESHVQVVLSEPLDLRSAGASENYTIVGVVVLDAFLGADSRTVTLTTAPLSEGLRYELTVSDIVGIEGGRLPPELVTEFSYSSRVLDGLIARYDLEEGAGSVVHDVSGFGEPLDLTIANLASVAWTEGGISIVSPTIIASAVAGTKIFDAVSATQEITVEAWIRPASLNQNGPARVVTLSADPGARNFTLGQQFGTYEARLRTTTTGANGANPALTSPEVAATDKLVQIVYTRNSAGIATFFVDAVAVESSLIGGDLSTWNPAYRFALANELTLDRPWFGDVHDVAIYNRALESSEVLTNFLAGADQASMPPVEILLAPMIIGIDRDTGDDGSDGITADGTLVFNGTAPVESTVTLRKVGMQVVGSAVADGAGLWTIDTTGVVLANGIHRFSATATDRAGNISVASQVFLVEIDTVAPPTPVIAAIDEDDGPSDSDAVTSDATLVFSGTAEPDSTVTLSEPGLGVLGVATTNEAGEWIVDATSTTLANGTYSFSAIARDVAGNESGAATAFVVEVVARHCLAADLTCNGFVDFEDLTVLLASWNQDVAATQGNLVDAANTPVNFEDLTVLLANWTGPAPAGSPHQEATAAASSISDDNRMRATAEAFHRIGETDAAHRTFLRGENRGTAGRESQGTTASTLRRFQAVAVDQAFNRVDAFERLSAEATRRERIRRRTRTV